VLAWHAARTVKATALSNTRVAWRISTGR
jgi:hypothetical protein